jgi:hypothetical protein
MSNLERDELLALRPMLAEHTEPPGRDLFAALWGGFGRSTTCTSGRSPGRPVHSSAHDPGKRARARVALLPAMWTGCTLLGGR